MTTHAQHLSKQCANVQTKKTQQHTNCGHNMSKPRSEYHTSLGEWIGQDQTLGPNDITVLITGILWLHIFTVGENQDGAAYLCQRIAWRHEK